MVLVKVCEVGAGAGAGARRWPLETASLAEATAAVDHRQKRHRGAPPSGHDGACEAPPGAPAAALAPHLEALCVCALRLMIL